MEKSGFVPSVDSRMRNDRTEVVTPSSTEVPIAVDRCPVFRGLQLLKNDEHDLSVSKESRGIVFQEACLV